MHTGDDSDNSMWHEEEKTEYCNSDGGRLGSVPREARSFDIRADAWMMRKSRACEYCGERLFRQKEQQVQGN